MWQAEAAAGCIARHDVTMRFNASSCVEMTASVPWPGSTASMSPPSSCLSRGATVGVRAVNNAGLAGPVALAVVRSTLTSTSAYVSRTAAPTTTSQTAGSADIWTTQSTTERPGSAGCIDAGGSGLCTSTPSAISRMCSVYVAGGRMSVVNRTETTIIVQFVSTARNFPLHSTHLLVRTADRQMVGPLLSCLSVVTVDRSSRFVLVCPFVRRIAQEVVDRCR